MVQGGAYRRTVKSWVFSTVCTLINGMRQHMDIQTDPAPIDYRLHLHGSKGIDQAVKGFVD